jgi:2-C-methyl-D-erythritol 4-phosphate cytidylyltransferase
MEHDEPDAALGVVPVDGRGALPYALVHGESLVAAASWALGAAEVELFDFATSFEAVRASGRPLVVHDPLCPLTPTWFLEQALQECRDSGAVVVGVRPVTDTVKEYDGTHLGATQDRSELRCVASPVVLPASVLASLEALDTDDLPALVAELIQRFPVRHLPAPPLARRVTTPEDLDVLAALSRVAGSDQPDR